MTKPKTKHPNPIDVYVGSRVCACADPRLLFEGATDGTYKPDGRAPSPAYVNEFVSSEDGLRLIKAFARITRPAVRHRIVALVREIAGDEGE